MMPAGIVRSTPSSARTRPYDFVSALAADGRRFHNNSMFGRYEAVKQRIRLHRQRRSPRRAHRGCASDRRDRERFVGQHDEVGAGTRARCVPARWPRRSPARTRPCRRRAPRRAGCAGRDTSRRPAPPSALRRVTAAWMPAMRVHRLDRRVGAEREVRAGRQQRCEDVGAVAARAPATVDLRHVLRGVDRLHRCRDAERREARDVGGCKSCACSMRRGRCGATPRSARGGRAPRDSRGRRWRGSRARGRARGSGATCARSSSTGCSGKPQSSAPSYGSSIHAVSEPSAPSAKNFTPPMRSMSSPSPVVRLRSIHSSRREAERNARTRRRNSPASLSACRACSSPRPTSIAWTPVTPRLWACAIASFMAAMRSVCVGAGMTSATSRDRGVAEDARWARRRHRVDGAAGGRRGVARDIGDAQRCGVDPDAVAGRVHEIRGVVGRDRVEVAAMRESGARPVVLVPPGAADPRAGRRRCGALGDASARRRPRSWCA